VTCLCSTGCVCSYVCAHALASIASFSYVCGCLLRLVHTRVVVCCTFFIRVWVCATPFSYDCGCVLRLFHTRVFGGLRSVARLIAGTGMFCIPRLACACTPIGPIRDGVPTSGGEGTKRFPGEEGASDALIQMGVHGVKMPPPVGGRSAW
jgi:hypothetical protein